MIQLELPRNPLDGIRNFDTSEHVYTEEEPNSLTVEEMPRFLGEDFFLGHRPSTLRPLRRSGPTPDFLPDEGVLLVRRSHSEGHEVMETTKTKIRQRITLPPTLVDILRWHIETQLTTEAMKASELLFPAEDGRFRSRSALKKPFATVSTAIGLKKHVTPRAMRRTFQDLARAAQVGDLVTRAISGHATETMQHHYSTVAAREAARHRQGHRPGRGPGGPRRSRWYTWWYASPVTQKRPPRSCRGGPFFSVFSCRRDWD